jgi:hypothetical protein
MQNRRVVRVGLPGTAALVMFTALVLAPPELRNAHGQKASVKAPERRVVGADSAATGDAAYKARPLAAASLGSALGNASSSFGDNAKVAHAQSDLGSPWNGLGGALMTYVILDEMLRRRWWVLGYKVPAWLWGWLVGLVIVAMVAMWAWDFDAVYRWLAGLGWAIAIGWNHFIETIDGPWMHRMVNGIRDKIGERGGSLARAPA